MGHPESGGGGVVTLGVGGGGGGVECVGVVISQVGGIW